MAKILYLHGLEVNVSVKHQRLLESAYGNENVKAPNLKTQQTTTLFSLSAILSACLYLLAGRGATHIMLKRSITIAEKAFKSSRSNIIVATSFGAITALQMDIPKCPMLLLAPAHEQYTKYMKIEKPMTIKEFPYVLIIHGCNDSNIPIEDSINLVETSTVGKCRLEIIEDEDKLTTITSEDMRSWVEEVYDRGVQEVMIMAQDGNKLVDPTLFGKDLDFDGT
ncbi:hypothetical protein IE077_001204 [Cardiosporidium cionae]|uniref:Phospholipase/carboxylesterase/thioesterase domain-containing protein n=1 Tax=Cardiosporidium cionae TaxID=476202 RepID=A0ABQ7J6J9_9APIC|nr:hypothetical protein IE077_001204 [Cardiosporidium cionae]|eukprot:KAF8819310.1 hypothetical protein IE077_001204 [Cardiosporidium cionae]